MGGAKTTPRPSGTELNSIRTARSRKHRRVLRRRQVGHADRRLARAGHLLRAMSAKTAGLKRATAVVWRSPTTPARARTSACPAPTRPPILPIRRMRQDAPRPAANAYDAAQSHIASHAYIACSSRRPVEFDPVKEEFTDEAVNRMALALCAPSPCKSRRRYFNFNNKQPFVITA